MMKRKICCLMLALMLFVSMALVLVSAKQQNVTGAELKESAKDRKIGKIHVDTSAVLKELGYTEENISNVPDKLQVQIARSYRVQLKLGEDGDYYGIITPDSQLAAVNLVGTDRVAPYDIDLSHAPDAKAVTNEQSTIGGSTDYLYNQRACLVFEIWDYPGTQVDLPQEAEDEYYSITDRISSTSAYDYWQFMSNSECTHYNVYSWITWACAAYESVDIYWAGHGTEYNDLAAFVCYDAWNDNYGVDTSKLYYAQDFTSGTYDYSTLRLGEGSFCYGWGFHDTFLAPGGTVTHSRAYMSSSSEISCDYTLEYVDTWGYWWYSLYENSDYSAYQSRSAAAPYLGQDSPFQYDDLSGGFWFR